MRIPLRLTAAVVALITVTAVSAASASSVDGPAYVDTMAWRVDPPEYLRVSPEERAGRELVDLVNALRAAAALPPVQWHAQVAAAAQEQSAYQAFIGRLSHVGEGGSDTGDRLSAQGFRWINWGENVGAGFGAPKQLLDAWLASGDHYQHLVGDFRYAGAGVAATASGTPYWTLVLAG